MSGQAHPTEAANRERRTMRRALRMPAVMDRVGLSRAGIYRQIQTGGFPPPYKLTGRVSVWDEQEVSDWLEAKMDRRFLSAK